MRSRKDVLDKAAWAWAESTEPSAVSDDHIAKAYRLNLPECVLSTCKRNCRGSPRCLSGLGENRWISDEGNDGCENSEDDPNAERRDSGSFLGLKNLGATCYVNSLLQLWFHNLPFRKAIYEWDPMDDPEERECLRVDETNYPVTAVGRLQVLFAQLQFGIRRYIDPSDFIHSLGLDTTQQQDAQEFSKLFISMLEDRLATQLKPLVHDMISKNFQGEYSYVTKCSTCLTESDRVAKFYELDLNIQGHRTLSDSLAEFLHEEKLEGANRYHCGVCGFKQDATRCIRLRSLPPVLHLQLLRFVYDRSKGHKKKLSSPIQFSEVLDMSEYIGKPPGTMIYNLSAILAHMGTSAHSGHYVATIKDSVTGVWHKFNDETVEEDGKRLSLGAEEDAYDSSYKGKGRSSKPAKGHLTSKNAYMLVYSLASEDRGCSNPISTQPTVCFNGKQGVNGTSKKQRSGEICSETLYEDMVSWGLEKRLRDKVHQHNVQFEEWASSEVAKKEKSKVQNEVLKTKMSSICQNMCTGGNIEGMDFISTAWLQGFLSKGMGEKAAVGPINNREELCPHNCVDPSKVAHMKIINDLVAKYFYDNFSGGPRLRVPESLCKECVVNKCREIRLRSKIISDGKEIAMLSKYRMDETDPGYWVGRASFKNWKSLAWKSMQIDTSRDMETNCPSSGSPDCEENGTTELDCEENNSISNNESNVRSVGLKEADKSSSHISSPKRRTSASRRKVVTSTLPTKKMCLSEGPLENGNNFTKKSSASSETPYDRPSLPGSSNIPDESMGEEPINCQSEIQEENESLKNGKDNCDAVEDSATFLEFNDDIICEHGNLDIDESKRRLVVPGIWYILQRYFPSAKEFCRNVSVCSSCQKSACEGEAVKESQRKIAFKQKEILADVYFNRKRPIPPCLRKGKSSNGSPSEEKEIYFILSEIFLMEWKKFISCKAEPPLCVRNAELLCAHGGLHFSPLAIFQEDAEEKHMLLYPREWNELKNFYSVDCEISVVFDAVTGDMTCSPGVCVECEESRMQLQRLRQCTYDTARIFVRRVVEDKDKEVVCPPACDPMDPEFSPQVAVPQSLLGPGIRRSERSRKPRGDSKELTVRSQQTLQELKRQIFNVFHVLPVDQHLSLNGQPLEGGESTLAELNVTPNAHLLLRADEPTEGAGIMDDYVKDGDIEEGFKGTGLLSR